MHDTIRWIIVRSKVDEIASLIQRTAQKRTDKEKIKTKAKKPIVAANWRP